MNWRCVVTAWVAASAGCAAPRGDLSGVKVNPQTSGAPLVAAEAEVKASADLDATAAVVNLETQVRDLHARLVDLDARITASATATVGGGGDSVTAWLYAMIAGAAVLYPAVIRPARLALERRQFRLRTVRARETAHARAPPGGRPMG